LFGRADGRHFVIVVSHGGDLPGVADVTLFRMTVSPAAATARVVELPATDGRLVRVLQMQTAPFPDDADAQDAILSMCQVLSVAATAIRCSSRPSRSAAYSPRCQARRLASCQFPRRDEDWLVQWRIPTVGRMTTRHATGSVSLPARR
jgi:hypothetical protein